METNGRDHSQTGKRRVCEPRRLTDTTQFSSDVLSQGPELHDQEQLVDRVPGTQERGAVQHGSVHHPDGGQLPAGGALRHPGHQRPGGLPVWDRQREIGKRSAEEEENSL